MTYTPEYIIDGIVKLPNRPGHDYCQFTCTIRARSRNILRLPRSEEWLITEVRITQDKFSLWGHRHTDNEPGPFQEFENFSFSSLRELKIMLDGLTWLIPPRICRLIYYLVDRPAKKGQMLELEPVRTYLYSSEPSAFYGQNRR